MPEWIIVYSLIIVFFIALPLVINLATKDIDDHTLPPKNMPETQANKTS